MEIGVLNGRVSRRTFLRGSALGGVGLATAAVIGCGGDDDEEVSSSPGTSTSTKAAAPAKVAKEISVRWAGSNPIPTLSPNSTAASESELHAIYDGLTRQVAQPGGGGNIDPGLAESWESPDGTGATWVFNLREAEWSDGTKFTAADVKWVHDFYKDPESQSRLISRVGTYVSSKVIDDQTIEITTKNDPIFPKREGIVFILPKHVFTDASINPEEVQGLTPVGTGAYVAQDFHQGQKVSLVKSPSGYRAGDIKGVTDIQFNWISETSTRMAALESGDLDYALQVPTIDAERVRGFKNITVLNAPPTNAASIDALDVRGTLVIYGQAGGAPLPIDPQTLAPRGLAVRRFGFAQYVRTRSELERRADAVLSGVQDGTLVPRIADRLPLVEAAEAHRRLESRSVVGKLLLSP